MAPERGRDGRARRPRGHPLRLSLLAHGRLPSSDGTPICASRASAGPRSGVGRVGRARESHTSARPPARRPRWSRRRRTAGAGQPGIRRARRDGPMAPAADQGPVHLFTGDDSEDFACDLAALWRPWIDELVVHRVAGSHLEIVRDESSLRDLARSIDGALDPARTDTLRVLVATAFAWEPPCRLAIELERVGCVVEAIAPPTSALHGMASVERRLPPRPRPSAAHPAPCDPGVPGVSGHRLRRPDSACAARDLRAGRPGNARRNTLADADRGVLWSRRDVLVDLLPFGGDVGRRGVRRALPPDCGCGQPRRGVGVGRAGGRRRPEDRRELGRARGGDRPRRALGRARVAEA